MSYEKKQFLYAFDKGDRDKLTALGYKLLKNDEDAEVFVFSSDCPHFFSVQQLHADEKVLVFPSNILTF